jgi:hypothetical protein
MLIASLPEDFIDEEEIAEALIRDREMDEDPSIAISMREFNCSIEEWLDEKREKGHTAELASHSSRAGTEAAQ